MNPKPQIANIRFTRAKYPVLAFADMILTLSGGIRLGANSVRLIEQKNGEIVVSLPRMPPKRMCSSCGSRHPAFGAYCPDCGRFNAVSEIKGLDVYYPMDAASREAFVGYILRAYREWEGSDGQAGTVDRRNAGEVPEGQRRGESPEAMGCDVPGPRR